MNNLTRNQWYVVGVIFALFGIASAPFGQHVAKRNAQVVYVDSIYDINALSRIGGSLQLASVTDQVMARPGVPAGVPVFLNEEQFSNVGSVRRWCREVVRVDCLLPR